MKAQFVENSAFLAKPCIDELADKFKDIAAELYKVRRSFEPQMTDAEIRAAFTLLRAPEQTTGTKTPD